MRRRFRLIGIIVFLIILILITGLFVIVFGRIDKTIEAYGTVMPTRHEGAKPRIDGIVRSVLVREGDTVMAGDTLVVLRSEEIELAVERAKRALDQKQSNLMQLSEAFQNLDLSASFEAQWAFANVYQAKRRAESAKEKCKRAEELYENNLISAEERDDKRLEHELAESYYTSLSERIDMMKRQYGVQITEQEKEVELAVREYELARGKLGQTVILAPTSGVVLTLGVEDLVGTRVSTGISIMEIGDLDAMCLIAQVRESDIPHVREGQEARIFINAFPHRHYKVFQGEVVAISPQPTMTNKGVVFETTVKIDDPWVEVGSSSISLKPGLTGKTEVVVKHDVRLIDIVFKMNR